MQSKIFWDCSNSIMSRKYLLGKQDAIAVGDILDIHNYLMKKNHIV